MNKHHTGFVDHVPLHTRRIGGADSRIPELSGIFRKFQISNFHPSGEGQTSTRLTNCCDDHPGHVLWPYTCPKPEMRVAHITGIIINSKMRPQCRPAFSIVVVLCKIICLELYKPYCSAPPWSILLIFCQCTFTMEFEQVSHSTLVSRLVKTFIFQINISKYFSLRSLPASTLGNFLLVW